ncbi:MAG: RDD family protein [Candidatus Eremiobacteraeota bacterium]|nr:RDD family protein [Candidatus Eremiobacteraeota bacterium]
MITLLLAPSVLGLAGAFLHEAIGVSSGAVLAVIAMIYVTLARGQLLGSSVLIDRAHFPEVFTVVERCVSRLGVAMPLIFVRDDIAVPIVALGFGEPYSLVLSSHWLPHFKDDELTFMVGREVGHIAAGHTRLTSLLSANGKENALVSLVFGAWLRRTEYTADRLGLLCGRSVDAAQRAIMVAVLRNFARHVDPKAFATQSREFAGDSVLRMGEWLSAQPYATHRMTRLDDFSKSASYGYWQERLAKQPAERALPAPVARSGRVAPQDCAGFGRRLGAGLIDIIVVGAIFGLLAGRAETTTHKGQSQTAFVDAASNADLAKLAHNPATVKVIQRFFGVITTDGKLFIFPLFGYPQDFFIYSVLLISVVGQTLGMMIVAVKVTTRTFSRPPLWLVLWRYVVAPLGLLSFLMGPLVRIELHDRLSGTRVVRLERTFERKEGGTTLTTN